MPVNQIARIQFTDAAAIKVKNLLDEEGNLALNLRVFITGGGCSGFQYGFTFDECINADDLIVEKKIGSKKIVSKNKMATDEEDDQGGDDGGTTDHSLVCLIVDSMSYQYLKGAEIDYREDINGSQFVIRNNPNAKTSCGCGSSFAADDPR